MRRALLLAATTLLLAAPAWAENPVLDAEGDADLAASLAEATEVQGVCYGYRLDVRDEDTGRYTGTYTAFSIDVPPGQYLYSSPKCPAGVVVLEAALSYSSSFSEFEDSATWAVRSDLPQITTADLDALGLEASDLTRDDRSETVLLNAVQALPRLAAEQAGRPPVVLEPNTDPLPSDARPTNTPGSDWLRENGALLGFCVLLVLAGVVLLGVSRRAPACPTSPRPR